MLKKKIIFLPLAPYQEELFELSSMNRKTSILCIALDLWHKFHTINSFIGDKNAGDFGD